MMPTSATIAASTPHWLLLRQLLDIKLPLASTADGIASAHAHEAREEAARKLITNHENVLKDVTNPSASSNIIGRPLTQRDLGRVNDKGMVPYVDEALREVARRLLGRRPGTEVLEVRCDPTNTAQAAAWGATAAYLDGRIQSVDAEKPGRKPDMSPAAAAAMRAVLNEVGMMPTSATIAASTPQWLLLRQLFDGTQMANDGSGYEIESALRLPEARDEAANALLTNRAALVKRVVQASRGMDIGDAGAARHVDEALRELTRRLMGRRPGIEALACPCDTKSATQVATWVATAVTLNEQLQSQLPDLSPPAVAAIKALLRELDTYKWDQLRDVAEQRSATNSPATSPNAKRASSGGGGSSPGLLRWKDALSAIGRGRIDAARFLVAHHDQLVGEMTTGSESEGLPAQSGGLTLYTQQLSLRPSPRRHTLTQVRARCPPVPVAAAHP